LIRALCISHDDLLLRTLGRILRSMSIEVAAPPPDEIRVMLSRGDIHVVIVDTEGPSRDAALLAAMELCPLIRRVQLCSERTPTIHAHVDAVLRSPFNVNDVRAAVGSLDELSRPSRNEIQDLDRERLLDCVKGDLAELDRMADLFVQGATTQIERARRAVAAGDHGEVRQALHRLCGAAATAGADRLAALCRREMDQMDGSDEHTVAMPQIDAALGAFRAAYARWRP